MVDTTVTAPTSQNPATPSGNTLKDSAAIVVALLAVAAFGAFVLFLLSRLGISESQWTRATYLLNGVEAIVFAAVGFLFGKEVHRGQAQSAEARARSAEVKAEQKTDEAAKGRALAAAVLAREPLRSMDALDKFDEGVRLEGREADQIVSVARRLFPDL